MSLSAPELKRFVLGLASRPDDWAHLITHSRRARVYHEVWSDEVVNAWLICWSLEHDTGWHDHDDSAAAIFVAEGSVQEERLTMGRPPSTRLLGRGGTFSVPASAIHRVRHVGVHPAVTLHAYSPPLRRTGAYTVAPGGELHRAACQAEVELRPEPALL